MSDAANKKPQVPIEIRPFDKAHAIKAFSCGTPRIDNWLKINAWREQKAGVIRVFCATYPGQQDVIGYYSLTFTAWGYDVAKDVVKTKFGELAPLPAIYLPRVGVCEAAKHQGIGSRLLIDAFRKSLAIAELAAVTTLTLDAIDEERALWYEHLGFTRFTPGGLEMGIALATIRKALPAAE